VAILPLSSGSNSFIISVESGGNQTGTPGLPLENPVVFKVVDKAGKPVPGADVQFEIKPGGVVSPVITKTDNTSKASVRVTLGDEAVDYTITAKVSGSTGSLIVKTEGGGGG
jgi:hypothetical protein